MANIQGIYVAIFGRPADPAGLAYWKTETNDGADLSRMIGALSETAEFKALYDGKTNTEIVTAVYQALFGRAPDEAGLKFFVDGLADGTLKIGSIAVSIIDGAKGSDKTIVDNKIAAADTFTASLDTPEEIAAYVGTAGADAGRAFLKSITDDPGTIPTQEATDAAILTVGNPDGGQAPVGGGGGGGGGSSAGPVDKILTFTDGDDDLVGGDGNDTFNAAALTLATNDQADGGSGTDTLNISGVYETQAAPTLNSIEIINNPVHNRVLKLENVDGVQQIWTSSARGLYKDADTATVFGTTEGGRIEINYVGTNTATVANLAVKDNSTLARFESEDGRAGSTLATINIDAQGDDTSDVVNVTGMDTAATTINVSGGGRIDVIIGSDVLETFNATDTTGGVAVEARGDATVNYTVSGGTGDDVLNFSSVSNVALKAGSLNGGAGNDFVIGSIGDDLIDGGAGADVLQGNGGDDIYMIDSLDLLNVAGIDRINYFETTVAKIEFGDDAGSVTNYDEHDVNLANFDDAKSAAENAFGITSDLKYYSVHTSDNNNYVFYNSDGNSSADDAVQLTGQISLDLIEFGDII